MNYEQHDGDGLASLSASARDWHLRNSDVALTFFWWFVFDNRSQSRSFVALCSFYDLMRTR